MTSKLKKITQHFEKVDSKLAEAMKQYPVLELKKSSDYFADLVEAIVSQQLSVKVSNVLYKRILDKMGGRIEAEKILEMPVETFRSLGISYAKASYIQDLAAHANSINFASFDTLRDEEIYKELIAVKGIGPWTIEMFLMFSMARPDIFSFGDLGLKRAITKLYQLKKDPTKLQLQKMSEKWKPYRTYACRILWKTLDNV